MASLRGARVLVTGASGFIGAHLARRLVADGAEVHAVSRQRLTPTADGVRWWQGELADPRTVADLFATAAPDLVYHLASHVVGARELSAVLPTFQSNLTSTVNVLRSAAEGRRCRVVLTGSLEEPASAGEDVPCSPYAAAKWAAAAYGRMFRALYELPVVNLRLFMVYGPAQRDLKKLVPYVTLSLLRGESPRLSSGTREVDWIFVDDVVDALAAAAGIADVPAAAIDVGSGALTTVRAVAEQLAEIVGSTATPHFGAIAERPMERIRRADVSRTASVLGWRPRVGLRAGLERTVAWYRSALQDGAVVGPAGA